MESQITKMISRKVVTEDNCQYFYIATSVEIPNALRTAVTILQEYSITDIYGKNHKLYKTKEGNWYEIESVNSSANHLLLMRLKKAINLQELNQ
jgi:hypothetical protein